MKRPSASHPISIAPCPDRVRIVFDGHTVAETTRALVLREASYPPVFYVPRADADMAMLTRSAHATRCPYKGDAAYYTLTAGNRVSENAAWSYETPFPAVAAIAGHLAFYPDRVDAIEVGEA
jgi:uncharacterized protein (DUF427 family)